MNIEGFIGNNQGDYKYCLPCFISKGIFKAMGKSNAAFFVVLVVWGSTDALTYSTLFVGR